MQWNRGSRRPPPSSTTTWYASQALLPYPDLQLAIPADLGSLTRITVASQVPGDVVLDLAEMTNQTIKLGAGLRQVTSFRGGKWGFVRDC